MRLKVYANFEEALDPIINVDSAQNVEIVIDYLIPEILPTPIPENTIRFVATIQPEGHFNHLIRQYENNYDYLLTFIPELLVLKKARFFIGLTAFCKPDIQIEKSFGVSCVFSNRNCLPGHKLRHELWNRRDEIKIPKYFYTGLRSGMTCGILLPAEKKCKQFVMGTMFHIAIDSFDYDNSFSEKLIDPLITNTIPIYWGPKNIDRFFNMDGIFYASSVDEIIRITNQLTEDDYNIKKLYRLDNFARAIEFHNYADCLERKINQILNENA